MEDTMKKNLQPTLTAIVFIMSLFISNSLYGDRPRGSMPEPLLAEGHRVLPEYTERSYIANMPLILEYKVTPDVDSYIQGQIVTVEYCISINTSSLIYEPGDEYLISLREYLIGTDKYNLVVRNDINQDDIISDSKQIHHNILEFQIKEDTARVLFMLAVFDLHPGDPNDNKVYPYDESSKLYFDHFESVLIDNKAWRKTFHFEENPPVDKYHEVSPKINMNDSQGRILGEYGALINTTVRYEFLPGTYVNNPFINPWGQNIGQITNWGPR